jgi:hypothetical protein
MYRIDEDMKEDLSSCDYYSTFIKSAIKELKTNGICYVFHKYQVDEILKYMKADVVVKDNDCGYTLNIPRNKRNYTKQI